MQLPRGPLAPRQCRDDRCAAWIGAVHLSLGADTLEVTTLNQSSRSIESAQQDTDLLLHLKSRFEQTVAELLPVGTHVAHVDYPNYSNVGDSAIWLGELAFLRQRRCRTVYSCSNRDYSPKALSKRLGDGIILLAGGGNFGDLWPRHQRFRKALLQDFPGNRIVQLPQSICFNDERNLENARREIGAHPDFCLLVRDMPSYELATANFDADVRLCPDSAFYLGELKRAGPPTQDLLYMKRTDTESPSAQVPIPNDMRAVLDAVAVDWLHERRTLNHRFENALGRQSLAHLGAYAPFGIALDAARNRLSRLRLERGVRLLSTGRRLITNRLHGHIIGCLLNLPHVVLDNSYGKNRAFYEKWTSPLSFVRWATDESQALELCEELAALDASAA